MVRGSIVTESIAPVSFVVPYDKEILNPLSGQLIMSGASLYFWTGAIWGKISGANLA